MCRDCGCGEPWVPKATPLKVKVETSLLKKTRDHAQENLSWLKQHQVVAVNLLSSPGSGKTTLLEHTIRSSGLSLSVLEGDQATQRDADRIRQAGGRVLQLNTGQACHLDPESVGQALPRLDPQPGLLLIENVGNLICPTFFELGESARVVLLSVTEGEDKPLKYPHAFKSADLVLITKIDLLPYVPFQLDQCLQYLNDVKPGLAHLQLSALTGQGMPAWFEWLQARG